MVSIAYILINMDIGKGSVLTEALKEIPEIKELYNVYGIYDYVVRVEAETIDQLKYIIAKKIRPLNHIKSTLTMIAIE
ncbi:unnamed protein product [marine sediment metagenome]|uniref:Transcription regulator AsnC/Lrp ligand binding domain-containing protein n=1 Tax=marine sediment metagenome TaxID=412755 RepID=X0ZYK2_9ZZZZ